MASFQFRVRTAAALVAISTVALLGASSVMAGCSSSSDTSTPDAAVQTCPTTIANAINTPACTGNPAGQPCVVGFICPGELNEVATCNCTGGNWACVDHDGNAITDPTAGTTCTNLGPGNDSQCPADEKSANFAGCKTSGLICSYAGQTCVGQSAPNTDTCQCVGGEDGGLLYHCEPNTCPGQIDDAGAPIDSGDQ